MSGTGDLVNLADLSSWGYLPLLIFLARVIDVSLGTLRIIFTARGRRYLAPLLGFVEVFIWIVAVSQITREANNLLAYLAYAAGFAAGNYVGIWLDNRLGIGTLLVRAILSNGGNQAADLLHQAGYGVTSLIGQGSTGPVQLIYTIIRRKDLTEVINLIHRVQPHAFLTVEEIRSAQQGIFPSPHHSRLAVTAQRKVK